MYPILRIDDFIDKLQGVSHFSKVYLYFGYHQLKVKEGDIPKMAFRTRYGDFQFLLMLLSLKNALTLFMDLMNRVFKPYLGMFLVVFIDDILMYSQCEEEHMDHIEV